MISRRTIDAVFDLPIEQVIGKYVELKKSGSSLKAPCPFHDEKTASFMVSPSKSVFKCFGCGKGGNNSVSFVMQKTGLTYPEAIKEIAQFASIDVEYDNSEQAEEYLKKKVIRDGLVDINAKAAEFFVEKLADSGFNRTSKETAELFRIGYAPKGNNLCALLRKIGVNLERAKKIGLVGYKDERFYDYFRERIIIPILSERGELIGFGGRAVTDSTKPKYLNTAESELYKKGESLFGLYQAKEKIRKQGFTHVVEGYFDVTSMYEGGLANTVSPCGTSLTVEQCRLIKKYCNHVVIISDGDNAGLKSMKRSVPICAEAGLSSEVVVLAEGEDPDTMVKASKNKFKKFIDDQKKDGIEWLCQIIVDEEGEGTIAVSRAQEKIEELLSVIDNDKLRAAYVKLISGRYKYDKREFTSAINRIISNRNQPDEDTVRLPMGVNREEYEEYGFYEIYNEKDKNTGYWFLSYGSNPPRFEKKSNFIIKPLFHIYSKTDNKRLIEMRNNRSKVIIDMPSKAFISQLEFFQLAFGEGNYWFDGSKIDFQRIVRKLSDKFQRVEEIKTMGWQTEGFYAFANGIIDGDKFKSVDSYGIVTCDDRHYFMPAFSSIYSDLRPEDDLYENDRFFVYNNRAEVDFKTWASQMYRVHQDNGMIAVSFVCALIFRDYIYDYLKWFPHAFLFGDVETGKSFCARSINAVFHGSQPGFNLTSGTNVGFFRKLAKFRNAVAWFDEYEPDIDSKRFQALKAAYDGLGHEKGVMSRDNRTETTKINSGSVISGQYLPTRDGNSLFTRSIVCTFMRKKYDLTQQDIEEGAKLKDWEDKGLSDIVLEIAKYRDLITDKFRRSYMDLSEDLGEELKKRECHDAGRVLGNYLVILSVVKILMTEAKMEFGFTFDQLRNLSIEMVIDQSSKVSNSDALAEFWKSIDFLISEKKIEAEIDYKIQTVNSLLVNRNRHEKDVVNFSVPTKIVFIRLRRIHTLYMLYHRQTYNVNGVDETSLKNYFKTNKAFVGAVPSTGFADGATSAYAFYYDKIGVELERTNTKNPKPEGGEQGELVTEREEDDLPF